MGHTFMIYSWVLYLGFSIYLTSTIQETKEGRDCLCATLCFENSGSELLQRISNQIYEQARLGELQLPAFPCFDPLVTALKQGTVADGSKSYRVSVQRHDQLMVLESYARKWLDDPNFEAQAKEVIKGHNDEYNASGEFVLSSERYGPGLGDVLFQKIFYN